MCKRRGWTVSMYEYGCACASVYDRVEDFGTCHMPEPRGIPARDKMHTQTCQKHPEDC